MNRLLYLIPIFLVSLANAQHTKGTLHGPMVWKSKIYPGTERNYWIHVPSRYDPSKPACIMVVQDGVSRADGWKMTAVMDSLMGTGRIPVMIGIFIDHGKVPTSGNENYPRYNRSFEYDALGDRYARFLLEELLPEVSKSYNVSTNPDDRAIAGASSGAICAFNVAWERPDQFHRVLSTIGTYVGLRGGDEFATLVRKTEPKPLRVFLEDGNHDLNIYAGDWWSANQNMLSALTWSGYEVDHAWGEGGHDSKHAVTIMAEALTWLWKDYPAPVQTHASPSSRFSPVLTGENWNEIPVKGSGVEKLAVGRDGEIFFTAGQSIYKLDNAGTVAPYAKLKGEAGGLSMEGSGSLYVSDTKQNKLIAIDGKGMHDVASNVHGDFLAASSKGVYFTETSKDRIGFYSFATRGIVYSPVPGGPAGLALSAEQTLLSVGITHGVFGYSFKVNEDGSLDHGQDYIHYHIPYGSMTPGTTGMTVDSDNWLYTATSMGIQISDQLGRVNLILSKPLVEMVDVKLAGPDFSTMFVIGQGKLYGRKLKSKGVLSWLPPVKPPKPGM